MKKILLITIIVLLSFSCGPSPEEINDEWFNYYNNTNSAIMDKLSEIMKKKGNYPSKEFCTNEDQLNQESRTGYKADGTVGENFTPQYWSKIKFFPFGKGDWYKGVRQTPFHSIEYPKRFSINWYLQLTPSNLTTGKTWKTHSHDNEYILYKIDGGENIEQEPISFIIENFTHREIDEFWVFVDSVRNEFMAKNMYIINKHGNFEKDKNSWENGQRELRKTHNNGIFHGISAKWDDSGEFLFPRKEIKLYHSTISSNEVFESVKVHLWRVFVDNLMYATTIDSTNPLIWFTLGEVFDDYDDIVNSYNGLNHNLEQTKKESHFFEKVLELDPLFKPEILYGFTHVDQYSKIISKWCSLAKNYKFSGDPGLSKYAYNKAFEKVGFDYPLLEYGRNILRSCDQNGILFVNGDNDTFPLWYLQDVENFRKDITVINLSLLNTKWHIKQIRDSRPAHLRFLKFSDNKIEQIRPIPWETQNINIPAKNEIGYIEWEMKPTYKNKKLRVQDLMILGIINETAWKFPIYFSITVANENKIGLDAYLEMEGMVFHLLDVKSQPINPTKIQENLAKYTYESIDNPLTEIYLSPLMRNYHSIYVQLAISYYMDYIKLNKKMSKQEIVERKRQKVEEILNEMFNKLPYEKIPYDANLYYQCGMLYYNIGNNEKAKGILKEIIDTDPDNQNAKAILEKINHGE